MKNLITLLLIILINYGANSLELTLPITIYENLSKSVNPIVGSSTLTIDREEFSSKTNNLFHEILEFNSGIKSRSIYGSSSSGSKTTLDIRGMGAQAKSNTLIMINGQRLNNIDMGEIDFPSIPIDSIGRVEIYKGNAATVLYGDGAIGGAINIITNPNFEEKNKNELIIKSGTFNKREYIYNNYHKFKSFSLNSNLNHFETDGYRDENESQQNNFTSQLIIPSNTGDHFLSLNVNEQIMSTPSDRGQDQLYTDRRGSDTPNDYISSEGTSILYTKKYKINSDSKLILSSSIRNKDSYSDLQTSASYPSYSETFTRNYQFTPRINQNLNLFNKTTNITYGLDLLYADYESKRKKNSTAIAKHTYNAWQTTLATYIQKNINLNDKLSIGAGIRSQRNSIGIGDFLNTAAPDYANWDVKHLTFLDNQINHAANIGFERKIMNLYKVYGRIGNGFRYPNIDDRIGGSGGTSLDLKTQKTNDIELGFKNESEKFSYNISTYVIDGKNELGYDSDGFVNININSTRRYGLEFSQNYKFNEKIKIQSDFTWAEAKYTSENQGSYATEFKNRDVPLVPQYSLDGKLIWHMNRFFKLTPSIKYQDGMRMESDDENFQETKIPRHFLTNLSLINKNDFYDFSLSIRNIFNEKYHNYAVASSSTNGTYNAYPEPGREITISLGFNF